MVLKVLNFTDIVISWNIVFFGLFLNLKPSGFKIDDVKVYQVSCIESEVVTAVEKV